MFLYLLVSPNHPIVSAAVGLKRFRHSCCVIHCTPIHVTTAIDSRLLRDSRVMMMMMKYDTTVIQICVCQTCYSCTSRADQIKARISTLSWIIRPTRMTNRGKCEASIVHTTGRVPAAAFVESWISCAVNNPIFWKLSNLARTI